MAGSGVYADLGNSPLNSRAGRGSLRESGILMHDFPTRTSEFRDSQKSASKPFLGEPRQIHAFALKLPCASGSLLPSRRFITELPHRSRSFAHMHPVPVQGARCPAVNLNNPNIFRFRPLAARCLEKSLNISRLNAIRRTIADSAPMPSQTHIPKSLEFRGFYRIGRAGGHPDSSISSGICLFRRVFQTEI